MSLPNLSKKTLFAAAVFVACASLSQAEIYDTSKGEYFGDYKDHIIEINPSVNHVSTVKGEFRLSGGAKWGKLVINATGAPVVIYGSYDENFYGLNDPDWYAYVELLGDGTQTFDPYATSTPLFLNPVAWNSGELVLNEGSLSIEGHINAWADLGDLANSILAKGETLGDVVIRDPDPSYMNGKMNGVSIVTIGNTGVLNLGSSRYADLPGDMVAGSDNIFSAINNVRAGAKGDQKNSRIDTGTQGRYHIAINVEAYDPASKITDRLPTGGDPFVGGTFVDHYSTLEDFKTIIGKDGAFATNGRDGGSIGVISGGGNVYKTGAGKLTILNDAQFSGSISASASSGSVYVAGGTVLLIGDAAREISRTEDSKNVLRDYYSKKGESAKFSHALWTASSVNIASDIDAASINGSSSTSLSEHSRQGSAVRYKIVSTTWKGDESKLTYKIKENYFARPDSGSLTISQNQIIKNFQSLFANGAEATDATKSASSAIKNAADTSHADSPIITGTGIGSYLGIGSGDTLAIYQEQGKGGIYKGSICGVVKYDINGKVITDGSSAYTAEISTPNTEGAVKGGNVVKYGSGDLALILRGSNYSSLAVLEGTLVTNVAAMDLDGGSYDWSKGEWVKEAGLYVASGAKHVIVENNAATLKTRMQVEEGASLVFSTHYLINTLGGEIDVSDNFRAPGTIEISEEQKFIKGDVFAQGGIELILTADEVYKNDKNSEAFSGGTFAEAHSVVVWGDAKSSKISFHGSDQKLNNITGNALSEINFGTGTLTAEINDNSAFAVGSENTTYGTFNGATSGIGNFVKTGDAVLTLGGGSNVAHYGFMGVAGGKLVATNVYTLQNASALVMNSGTSAEFTGTHSFNALFGFAGSTVDVSAAGSTLTLGESSSRIADIAQASADKGGVILTMMLANTDSTDFVPAGGSVAKLEDSSFFKPLHKIFKSGLEDSKGNKVLTQEQWSALEKWFKDGNIGENDVILLNNLFGKDASGKEVFTWELENGSYKCSGNPTRADISRMYLTLLAKTTFGAKVGDAKTPVPGNVVSGDISDAEINAALERLAYDGTLKVANLDKIGSTRTTLSGKLEAKSVKISAGALELDWDALLPETPAAAKSAEAGNTEVVAGNVADGISVAEGALFAVNTHDATKDVVLNEKISGKGNFEKLGSGKLILGENVIYSGTTIVKEGDLQMTLRNAPAVGDADSPSEQGKITVSSAKSTLYFDQAKKVEWKGTLENSGNLTKLGSGELILSGMTTVAGNISADAGTLTIRNANLTGEEKQKISVAKSATFNFDLTAPSMVFKGELSGSGTIGKLGSGELTLSGKSSNFAGTFSVQSGSATIDTENIFAFSDPQTPEKTQSNASVAVSAGADLKIKKSQTFAGVSGAGTIHLANKTELAIELNGNEKQLTLSDEGGKYIKAPDALYTKDSSGNIVYAFQTLEGKIVLDGSATEASFSIGGDGSGTLFVTNEEALGTGVSISVSSGQLIANAAFLADRDINIGGDADKSGEIVFWVEDLGKTVDFTGNIAENGVGSGKLVGKIGAGTLSISGAQTLGGGVKVYEGTMKITGSSVFEFKNAVVAEGATLDLACSNSADNRVKLSEIVGSGTIKLSLADGADSATIEIDNKSMKPVSSKNGDYFNGTLSFGAGVNVQINEADKKGITLCAIASEVGSTLSVFASDVTIVQNRSTEIAGVFNALTEGVDVTITGLGKTALEKPDDRLALTNNDSGGRLNVKNGSLQINSSAKLDGGADKIEIEGVITVENKANIYVLAEERNGDESNVNSLASVEIDAKESAKVGEISIVKTGEKVAFINLEDSTDGGQKALSVGTTLWDKTVGATKENGASLTLGVEKGELVILGVSKLASDVKLATIGSGTLVFKVNEGDDKLSQSVYGDGNFEKRGDGLLNVSSNQSYTGTTKISGGVISYGKGTTLQTKSFTVTGDGTLKGGITLSKGGFTLSGDGKVELDVSKGDTISYFGTLSVSGAKDGSIILSGANAALCGNEMFIFKALDPNAVRFSDDELEKIGDKITNNSSRLMISQTSNGTISAYAIQDSFSNLKGVSLRDGLSGSFTSVLDALVGGDLGDVVLESKLDPVGAALNKSSAGELARDIANLSPISFASMVAMPLSTFRGDIDRVAERTAQRRYDNVSMTRENFRPEFFALSKADIVTNKKSSDAANYDFNTYGALVGMDVKLNDSTLVGFSLGADYGSADIHDNGGKIKMDNYRATIFASGLMFDETWFYDAGVQFGMSSFDTKRSTLISTEKGDADGLSVGVFGTIGRGFVLHNSEDYKVHLTPYAGLSYVFTKVDSFGESGGQSALDVDSFDASSLRARLGLSLHWLFPLGDWNARLTFDAGFSHEFMDDEVGIDARFSNASGNGGKKFSVDANALSSDVISAGPSLSIDLSERSSLFFGYSVEYGVDDEQFTQGFNIGFRHSF